MADCETERTNIEERSSKGENHNRTAIQPLNYIHNKMWYEISNKQ